MSATYSNGYTAAFTDSGLNSNITITAGGVAPASLYFTNTATPYTFSGGGITGTASVSSEGQAS